ncbi:hypothetical protein AVEN_250561-1 [Araneus ventricosus]|uniref:Regulatory protein zeste n=1 Tax=Araneus ventricosus TaxID=182803 RepID=A0A4Y2FSU3_ARAVE|nr:hypothetical protein AVEN_250561-1 [Araneus ventricosus]
MIVEEMEGNPFLNRTKFISTYIASKRNEDWEELAKKLNTAGGAIKNVNGFHDSKPELCTDQANTLEFERTCFVECLLPDTAYCVSNIEEMDESASVPRSGTPQRNTPQATPETKDARVQSFKKRVRNKPLFMKNESAQKLVEGQTEVAKALKRCAEAMERQNELKERALEMENRKVDAVLGILHLLENKLC